MEFIKRNNSTHFSESILTINKNVLEFQVKKACHNKIIIKLNNVHTDYLIFFILQSMLSLKIIMKIVRFIGQDLLYLKDIHNGDNIT